MNTMTVKEIRRVGENRLEYSYTVEGEWTRYFEPANPMWAEYSLPVAQVADSIAVLPLIGNVIVLASLMDAEIYVDEIDKDFYQCVEEFIRGFETIMPEHVHFKSQGLIHANKIVDNPLSETEREENLLFFSGGVDATSSLVTHMEEKPALVTIWGADIPWDNEETWNRAIGFNQEVADRHGLKMLTIRSNFRKSFQDDNVNDYSYQLVADWWWPAFHHSISMMCLAAPLAYGRRKNLYFGSTYSSKDLKEWGSYVNASDPQVDNYVRFCGCQVVHDGYELSRYNKMERICEYYSQQEIKPYLRICYNSNSGTNCGMCEKCTRAIMTMLLLGVDPRAYGFKYGEEVFITQFVSGLQELARTAPYTFLSFYTDIQKAYQEKYSIEQVPPVLRVFYETKLETLVEFLHVPNNEYLAMVNRSRKIQDDLYRQIGQLKYQLETCGGTCEDKSAVLAEDLAHANEQNRILAEAKQAQEEQLLKLYQSTSWKLTKPLRFVGEILKNRKNLKKKIKEKIYFAGLDLIRRRIPEGSWKHDYVKWRWWFICSDQYDTRFKSMFHKMLQEYDGKLWNRGRLIKLDYWLCWIFLGAEPEDYFDFEYFRKGWFWRNHHITRQRLNFFDPIFNEQENMHLVSDKSEFYKRWSSYLKRNWCIPQDVTFEEFQSLFGDMSRLLVKPAASFGGHGIYAVGVDESNLKSTYEKLHSSDERIVVEEYVRQKGFLHDIYPLALNPLRVTTIRVGEKAEVCYAFFTVGCKGNIVANDCSGGIVFSVDTQTGKLGIGQGRASNGHRVHPDTGVPVAGQYVPDWERIKEFVCEAHSQAPENVRLIGWDVCWNDGELSLIEGNRTPGFPELPNRREDQWKMMKAYLDRIDQK